MELFTHVFLQQVCLAVATATMSAATVALCLWCHCSFWGIAVVSSAHLGAWNASCHHRLSILIELTLLSLLFTCFCIFYSLAFSYSCGLISSSGSIKSHRFSTRLLYFCLRCVWLARNYKHCPCSGVNARLLEDMATTRLVPTETDTWTLKQRDR